MIDSARLDAAYQTALAALLNERHPDGYWVGELSTSALSTATAVMALHLMHNQPAAQARAHQPLIDGGLRWLVEHQNPDGGWGDTTKSFSNISTTMLCRAAFYLTGAASRFALAVNRAEAWLFAKYGNTPEQLAEAVRQRYGKDRTFATPILTTCALAGLIPWKEVPPLPFELAVFPQSWFRFLRLHVVSYALPALIAIGQCIYHHKKPWNPLTRLLRMLSRKRSLRVLERIQPSSGGFLEAIPLTSFVTLSLAACGLASHAVATKGVQFLVNSVRPDGNWAIDSNLSTWVTTLAINALAAAGDERHYPFGGWGQDWLFDWQFSEKHPYTDADPGGWGWTSLPGSVPDADDTAGALLALSQYLSPEEYPWRSAIISGLGWLLQLQNTDGGWPTFCRGWGSLPFDRSGCDLTAHVIRAFSVWMKGLVSDDSPVMMETMSCHRVTHTVRFTRQVILDSIQQGLTFLARHQRSDGSWLPLWFGNQHAPDDENPTYGTARVLAAYRDLGMMDSEPARRGVAWLLANQNDDGGWGGCKGCPSTMEETALAVEILLDANEKPFSREPPASADAALAGGSRLNVGDSLERGMAHLIRRVETGGLYDPAPIGFYFAKLWYYEKLYPIIFTVAALGRARRIHNTPAV